VGHPPTPLLALQKALGDRAKRLTVVHRRAAAGIATSTIAPGVEAIDIDQFVSELNRR
jgi:hypothetical protein